MSQSASLASRRRITVRMAILAGCLPLFLLQHPCALIRASERDPNLGSVELLRDRWGVPHVFSDSDAGAMYGLGYATAQDRGFQMHYSLRMIQGRLAEVIGDVKKLRRDETAVQNDQKMRTFGFATAAEQRVKELDEETRGLLEAYSAGVNAWFEEHGDALPGLFDKTGLRPEPWTPADCLLAWWHLAQFFATDGTRDLMHYRNIVQGPSLDRELAMMQARAGRPGGAADLEPIPQSDSAAVVGRHDVTDAWVEKTRAFMRKHGFTGDGQPRVPDGPAGPKFSHAWVVDGKYSGSGGAVLVSMPQTPVTNPSLFCEFHIHGKTFDARGVGVPGSPVILIGWTPDVAWGMTALGADQADLFRLKTDDEHPDQYEYDGKWRDIEVVKEQIKVKGGRTRTFVVRRTLFGPIVNAFAFSRPGDPLVALKRVPICDSGKETMQGALAMMRATNVREFFSALSGWRFPTANVVYGDSNGEIGYSTVGALPLRSPLALDGSSAAHDGSRSECDWRATIPQDLVPHVLNPKQGYLFSGNHRPVGAFYPIPLGIRTGAMGDSSRSWRLRQLFANKTSMTEQHVRSMIQDATNPGRRAIVRMAFHLRDQLNQPLPFKVQVALDHLESWYRKGSPSRLDVEGAELAMLINTQFRFVNTDLAMIYGGGESGMSHCLKTVNARLDKNPKAEISPIEQEYVERLLTEAWDSAERMYGLDTTKWRLQAQKQVAQRLIPYYGSLDGFPSLDPTYDLNMPELPCVDGATVFSQAAQAYVQWVPMAHVDDAESLLPPGSSEIPGSPQRLKNVDAWARGELHPAPLSREAVDRVTVERLRLSP